MARRINPTTDAAWLAEVLRLLTYDPVAGTFTWNVDRYRPMAGRIAGTVKPSGYRVIRVAGRTIRAHRLAWLFVHGALPPNGADVDHKNGQRDDNWIENLRPCTRGQNLCNGKAKGASPYRGVSFDRARSKWQMQIAGSGARRLTRRYDTEIEAARAYDAEAAVRFGAFAKLNFPNGESHG